MGEIIASVIKLLIIAMALMLVGSIIGLGYELATYQFFGSAPFWNWLTCMYVGAIISIVYSIIWINKNWHRAK